jgi:hypothetical protein
VFLARVRDSRSCRELQAEIFGVSSPWGVHHLPKVSSQGSKRFGRSIDRKFGVDPLAFFFGAVQEVPTLRLYVPVGPGSSDPKVICSGRGEDVLIISSGGSQPWSRSSDLLVVCSGRLLQF